MQRVVDECRGFADHVLEIIVRDTARLVGIHDELDDARRVYLGLLHDPAAHARRFLPVNLSDGIASHIIAKRVHFRADARPVRRMLLTFDRTEAIVGDSRIKKPRKHYYFASTLNPP